MNIFIQYLKNMNILIKKILLLKKKININNIIILILEYNIGSVDSWKSIFNNSIYMLNQTNKYNTLYNFKCKLYKNMCNNDIYNYMVYKGYMYDTVNNIWKKKL